MNYDVLIARDIDGLYSYSYDNLLDIGRLVAVNVREREYIGVIVSISKSNYNGSIKRITKVLNICLPKKYIEFTTFVSEYNLVKLGSVLKLIIPFSLEKLTIS